MAGHSKWSQVKHIKRPLDVERGATLRKLVKEITSAARIGGSDLSGNPRLRAANPPTENIERAIEKDTSELAGVHDEETLYEACAPGGVALVIEDANDHKNRIAADLRFILSKNHGSFAASGSVIYMFHQKEQTPPFFLTDEERTSALTHDAVAGALGVVGVSKVSQKHPYQPDHTVPVPDEGTAAQVLRLYEALDDDDTQNVYPNFEIIEDVLARLPA